MTVATDHAHLLTNLVSRLFVSLRVIIPIKIVSIEVFMDRFSNSCREVAQNGRRGALMLTISVHHPQIKDFIKIKRDLMRITGANTTIATPTRAYHAVEIESNRAVWKPTMKSEM